MDRYAVIGNPIAHSRSPEIHARFAAQTGQVLSYERLLAPVDGFAATVQDFAAAGGRGCNVTVPFKGEAWKLAVRRTPRAQLAEAANTLRFEPDGLWADNTDGIGLVRDIVRNARVPLGGRRVLLVGAGGAAAGVCGSLLEQGPAELVCANRTPGKAEAMVARHAEHARQHGVRLRAAPVEACGTAYDVVVNGTSSSLAGGPPPVGAEVLREGTLVIDMMYGPAAAGLMDWAARHAAIGRDGLGMLVEQAAEAFALWRGVVPDAAVVLAEMRAALEAPQ